jgi:4-amino-4-deoxy-L-arabinose transferase-like glycosyltransferase
MSPAFDEPKHAMTGIIYLAHGWCCYGGDNTPMVALNAIPLWVAGAMPILDGEEAWLARGLPLTKSPLRRTYFISRLANLALVLLLLLGLTWYLTRAFGPTTAAIACLIISLEPNLTANSALVSPDFHVAATMTLACLATAELLDRGFSVRRMLVAGALVGIALLSKYSALTLGLGLPLAALLQPSPSIRLRGTRILGILGAFALTVLVVMVAYGVPHWLGGLNRISAWPFPEGRLSSSLSILTEPPVVADVRRGFLGGLEEVRKFSSAPSPSYFHGMIGRHFLLFYPALLLLKTPLVLLMLAIPGAWLAWRARATHSAPFVLLVASAVLFVSAMMSGTQLGIRHILPVLPALGVAAALAIVELPARLPFKVALVGILAFTGVRYHPFELSYFNEVASGPEQGWHYFVDSNLDWGQDLFALEEATQKLGISVRPFVHSSGMLRLAPRTFERTKPITGWIAVSLTRRALLYPGMYPADWALVTTLKGRRPAGRIGYSILLFYIPPPRGAS